MSYFKFVKNIFTIGFLDLLGVIQGIVFLSFITKILGAEDYGVWSQVRVTMSLVVAFTYLGLHEALIRFIPGEINKEELKEGVYSSISLVFFINLIIALFLIIFSGYVSVFLKFDPIFVKLLALIIIFESLNTIFLVIVRATKEIGKLAIMPHVTVVGHNKIGDDEAHDHYEFSLKNNGKDNAFDIKIEIFHKGGSTVPKTILMIGAAAADRVIDKSIDKDTKLVNYKISYKDVADNTYTKELSYDIQSGTSH